jgi:hypothetical protein
MHTKFLSDYIPQNIYVENLALKKMVSESRTFGRGFGNEGRVFMVPLFKKGTMNLFPFHHIRTRKKHHL